MRMYTCKSCICMNIIYGTYIYRYSKVWCIMQIDIAQQNMCYKVGILYRQRPNNQKCDMYLAGMCQYMVHKPCHCRMYIEKLGTYLLGTICMFCKLDHGDQNMLAVKIVKVNMTKCNLCTLDRWMMYMACFQIGSANKMQMKRNHLTHML